MGRIDGLMLAAVLVTAAWSARAQEMTRDQFQAKIDAAIARQNTGVATRGIILNNSEDYNHKLYPDPAAPPPANPAAPSPAAPSPPAKASPPATSALSLHAIRFAFASARVEASSYPTLTEMASALADPKYGDYVFLIVGHTDSRGAARYNLKLSRERADSVVDYLVGKDVPYQRLVPLGRGSLEPADPDHPASEVNRRVEIQVARRAEPR